MKFKTGDRVITSSGFCGVVLTIRDDDVSVKCDNCNKPHIISPYILKLDKPAMLKRILTEDPTPTEIIDPTPEK